MNEVDKYLDGVDKDQKIELERIRKVVLKTSPDVDEVISYGMPVYKYNKKYLIGFAAFKNHMSVFPGSEAVERLASKLSKYKISKGTIQFTIKNPLSDSILKEMIDIRKRAIDNNA